MEKYSWWKESKCKGPEAREWLVMNKVFCVAGVEMRPDKQGFVDKERRWKPLGGYKLLSLRDRDSRSSCTRAPPTIFSLSSVLSPGHRCLDQGLLWKSLRGNREAKLNRIRKDMEWPWTVVNSGRHYGWAWPAKGQKGAEKGYWGKCLGRSNFQVADTEMRGTSEKRF